MVAGEKVMLGDFNTGPNAPCKRSRVAQGMHIRRRRPTPNAHLMRVFGCYGRHSPEGSPPPASSRSAAPRPSPNHPATSTPDHPAAPDLGRTIPRHYPEPFAGRLKTEKRLGLQLFCDWGLSWTPPIADRDAKAQIIGCAAAYFRFRGAEKSP